jgi:hypothetical protein
MEGSFEKAVTMLHGQLRVIYKNLKLAFRHTESTPDGFHRLIHVQSGRENTVFEPSDGARLAREFAG